ncbi:metal ABC transporter solute-binding protein, Zn/Mn family [Ureibacillus sinduriensis]|uniref:metal ABC transporter solute-binding protein, Zn/Mn family n=1 Tax=Ureibacillus sinduriensis TaxID=561440 RepID=UPI0005620312|nr:zinc ABC transporter substrate-binding protein [Ureibacillus sinduriensis]
MNKKLLYTSVLATSVLFAGCQATDETEKQLENDSQSVSENEKLEIVTSFYPMYEFTKQIAGDTAEVTMLIPSSVEPHDWEPAAKDLERIQNADALIFNNENMETWIGKVEETVDTKNLAIIDASMGIDLLPFTAGEHVHGEDDHEGETHEHGSEQHDHEGETHEHGSEQHDHEGETHEHGSEQHDHEGETHEHGSEQHDHEGETHEHGSEQHDHEGETHEHGSEQHDHEGETHEHGSEQHDHEGETHEHGSEQHDHEGETHEHGSEQHDHEGETHEHGSEQHDHEGETHDHKDEQHEHEGETQEHEDGHHEHHHEFDPHLWLSPKMAIKEVENIANELIKVAPENKEIYEENKNNYIEKLQELDSKFETALTNVGNKEIITQHAAFGYLAHSYGLTQVPIAGLSPDAEPSAMQLNELKEFAKEHNINTIFFEENASSKVAETLANELNAKTAVLNTLEGLSEENEKNSESYISIMEENLTVLQEALK